MMPADFHTIALAQAATHKGTDMTVKYPHIKVQLTGRDGNAFAIMGAVDRALHTAGVSSAVREAYRKESVSGDYDHLLATAMRWVDVS